MPEEPASDSSQPPPADAISDPAEPLPEEPKMEIHKPKPVHNWREFLTELAIVVLGVGIALSAEQTVEWLHWRSQLTDAKHVIATELAENVAGAISRLRTEQCIERRLDALATILDDSSKSGSLPPIGDIGVPTRALWSSGAWESVVASQVSTHFPGQQLANLAITYKTIARIDEFAFQEYDVWSDLYTMVGPGRRLNPSSEAALRQALNHARDINRSVANLGQQLIARVNHDGLEFSADDLAVITTVRNEPLISVNANPTNLLPPANTCGPLGAVPATYGQGHESDFPAAVPGILKSLPDFSRGAQ